MDKLKIFLATVKKHQFWVCCGVMLLTALICWWWASDSVAKVFENKKKEIDGDFAGAVVPPNPPNQGVIDKITQQDGDLKLKVYHAWESLYNEQKKNNPFPTKVFGEEFKQEFEKLQLPKDQLDPKYLDIYQNHIKNCLPILEDIVKVRKEVGGEGTNPGGVIAPPRPMQMPTPMQMPMPMPGPGGAMVRPGMPMPGGPMMPGGPRMPRPMVPRPMGPPGTPTDPNKEYTGIVDWDAGDYAQLEAHFDWGGRAPTTLEVAMAQEDLWVYEALLRVIRKVNLGATTQANATVKRIVALDIGRDSRAGWDEARAAVWAPARAGLNTPMSGDPRALGGMPGQTLSGSQQAEQALFTNRYVDEKGQPLPYDPEYAKHPTISEFKMMPIFLSLVMDQRRLPMLLVECANSSMPIEVRGVRILKETIVPFEPSSAAPGLPGGVGAGQRMSPAMGGMRAPDTGAAGADAQQDASAQFDAPVQVYAVIYIYNPPDRARLGIPEEKTPPEATPPTNAPATQASPAKTPGK